jgi:1-acyl-sn-glycerol-3-phosphate acyltransferase
MAEHAAAPEVRRRVGDTLLDLGVTLLCWAWFVGGFLLIFSWAYLLVWLLARDRQGGFQRLNHHFFRVFFLLLTASARRHKLSIDPRLATIRGAVVVCNHLSYLDPLFLVALFPRHRTIVKTRFFSTPIFGAMIARSGYLPATGEGRHASLFLQGMESMSAYLASGGNLFIFPEGTRSRDGRLGPFHPGALKIARMCRAPIYVLRLSGSDRLFTPGRFLFNAHLANTIAVDLLGRLEADGDKPAGVAELDRRLRQVFSGQSPRE